MGTCTVCRRASLEEILQQTPTGKIAMFDVVSVPSRYPDYLLGERVYIKDGSIHDFITDSAHGPASDFDLHFVNYIDHDSDWS
jgi:hypothetical protein